MCFIEIFDWCSDTSTITPYNPLYYPESSIIVEETVTRNPRRIFHCTCSTASNVKNISEAQRDDHDHLRKSIRMNSRQANLLSRKQKDRMKRHDHMSHLKRPLMRSISSPPVHPFGENAIRLRRRGDGLVWHLRQPRRRSNPRLIIDRRQQRRQGLEEITDRCSRIGCRRSLPSVPNGDLWL